MSIVQILLYTVSATTEIPLVSQPAISTNLPMVTSLVTAVLFQLWLFRSRQDLEEVGSMDTGSFLKSFYITLRSEIGVWEAVHCNSLPSWLMGAQGLCCPLVL